MGGKYEIRWKRNRKCPYWAVQEFTDSLMAAYVIFAKAVVQGNSCVEMEVHDWKDCPDGHDYSCDGCEVQ